MTHVVYSKSLTEGATPAEDCTFRVPCLYMNVFAEGLDGFTFFCDCSIALTDQHSFNNQSFNLQRRPSTESHSAALLLRSTHSALLQRAENELSWFLLWFLLSATEAEILKNLHHVKVNNEQNDLKSIQLSLVIIYLVLFVTALVYLISYIPNLLQHTPQVHEMLPPASL